MLSSRNSLVESTELGSEVVYGQGKMLLPIDPANNFIRFNIFKQVSTSNAPVPMGLNLNSSFKIAFGKNSKLEFANMKDAAYENLQYGQIAFKISKEQALSILDLADDLFIITVIAEDGTESMIYTGKWRSSTDYQSIIANEKAEVNEIIEAQRNSELIESLTKKVADLESSVAFWQRNAATRQIKVGSVMVEPSPSINAISALPVTSAKVENVSQTNVIQSQSIAAKPIPVSQVIKNDTTTKGGIL
jgi:hypothetical protein